MTRRKGAQCAGVFFPALEGLAEQALERLDFFDILLDFMLSFLQFEGALHTHWHKLRSMRWRVVGQQEGRGCRGWKSEE